MSIYSIYNKQDVNRKRVLESKQPPNMHRVKMLLAPLCTKQEVKQALHDIENKRLPDHLQYQRAESLAIIVNQALDTGYNNNFNTQSAIRDLAQMLGYTSSDKILGELPDHYQARKDHLKRFLDSVLV